MNIVVKLAVYIGKGKIGNSIIRVWTGRQESHCELIVDGLAYSSSVMDKGVRKKYINLESGKWHVVDIPWASKEQIIAYYEKTKSNKYGWWSLISSQVFNRNRDSSNTDFCSGWCAEALGIPNPNAYSPGTLTDLIEFLNEFRERER